MDLTDRQTFALRRSWGFGEHRQRVAIPEITEGVQRGGVVLAQGAAQHVGVPGAGPDQVLVPSGQHLDRLGVGSVTGDRSMVVTVSAHQIGEHLGVTSV